MSANPVRCVYTCGAGQSAGCVVAVTLTAHNYKFGGDRMNRRQRKKQFKKKYGVTPAQALDLFSDTINDIIPQMMESVVKVANAITDWAENDLPKIMDGVNEYVREHSARTEEG